MLKQFSATFIGLLLATVGAQGAIAETVMEKIIRTGNLTIGANLDNVPFSYINENNEVVGYSIDIADRIREEVGKELGRDVVLQIVEVQDMSDALPKVKTGELDIVCDTAFTWERDRYVDFTVSYAVAGIQLLVPNDTPINSPEALVGKRIALVPNTVVEDAIKIAQSKIQVVPVTSVRAGMEALKKAPWMQWRGMVFKWRDCDRYWICPIPKLFPNQQKLGTGLVVWCGRTIPAFCVWQIRPWYG
ncbi:transporter substrate-binding domain-containing protein [Synechocystis sp. B12]|nr:transporter substrate-binding domain-containing protein [Synechocystis sp. B12]